MEIYGGTDDAYIPLRVLNQLFTVRNYQEIFCGRTANSSDIFSVTV